MAVFSQLSEQERAELWACLALRYCRGLGLVRANKIITSYGSAYAAVQAVLHSATAWSEQDLTNSAVCSTFRTQKWREQALVEWQQLQQTQCHIMSRCMMLYPALLKEIPDAPLLLYAQGDVGLLGNPAISVVGARKCTREGLAVAAFFSRDLSKAGVTVISGMAKGIDRVAHLAGLEGCGKTIAVMGTGIEEIYPPCNQDLAGALKQEGLLLSELPPHAPAMGKNFPVRNRIISGLSRGVLVVEAAERSGTLITARLALEQGREVFAVPGHTTATASAGCRDLIRRGAKAVFNADDILAELAPLLTLDARHALVARQKDLRSVSAADRAGKDAPSYAEWEQAQTVLPEGVLPWEAPVLSKQPAKKSTASGAIKKALSHASSCKKENEATLTDRCLSFQEAEGACDGGMPVDAAVVPLTNATESNSLVLSSEEYDVLFALEGEMHIDVLSRSCGLDVALLSRILTVLEIRGVVRRRPGMYYSCAPETRSRVTLLEV